MTLDLSGMTPVQLRTLNQDAQTALDHAVEPETALADLRAALNRYADSAGITVVEAWRRIAPDGVGVPVPEPIDALDFVQPTGAHDAYMTGDLVTFDGTVYRAAQDNVTWSPAAYPPAWERST